MTDPLLSIPDDDRRPEPTCGAVHTISRGNHAVCVRYPSEHAGLDHHDPGQSASWPICATYCATSGHACGRYRGDTAARYADA